MVYLPPSKDMVFDTKSTIAYKDFRTRFQVLLAGLGAIAIGVGAALLALDGRCASPATEGAPCKRQHELAGAGWTLVGVGLAAEIGLLTWVLLPVPPQLREAGAP